MVRHEARKLPDQNVSLTSADVRQELDRLWLVLSHMMDASEYESVAQRFHKKAEEAHQKTGTIRSELQSIIKQSNDETTKYLNTVAVVGYAAYFTTWNFTKSIMTDDVSSLIGLLGMISVSAFVLWEIWLTLSVRLQAINEMSAALRDLISHEDFDEIKSRLINRECQRTAIVTPIYHLVFGLSSCTAFAGGLLMMHTLYSNL